jgi:hypothetical protein
MRAPTRTRRPSAKGVMPLAAYARSPGSVVGRTYPDWMPPFSRGADDATQHSPRLSLALQECRVHYRFPALVLHELQRPEAMTGALSTLAKERADALLVLLCWGIHEFRSEEVNGCLPGLISCTRPISQL